MRSSSMGAVSHNIGLLLALKLCIWTMHPVGHGPCKTLHLDIASCWSWSLLGCLCRHLQLVVSGNAMGKSFIWSWSLQARLCLKCTILFSYCILGEAGTSQTTVFYRTSKVNIAFNVLCCSSHIVVSGSACVLCASWYSVCVNVN